MELSLALVGFIRIYENWWHKNIEKRIQSVSHSWKIDDTHGNDTDFLLQWVPLNSMEKRKFPLKFTSDSVNAPTPSDNVISRMWEEIDALE